LGNFNRKIDHFVPVPVTSFI